MIEITLPGHFQHYHDIRMNYWYYEEGDEVVAGTHLCEVTSEEGPFVITAHVNGMLDEVFFQISESINADDIIATIDEN